MSREEYLAHEEVAEAKSEFFDGEAFAMTGASRSHARIQMNLARLLGTAVRGGSCEAFGSDLRVKVRESGLYTYPDLSVVCGEVDFEDDRGDTLANPVVLVEVLSPSTEAYDRGLEFEHYARIPTLRHYVLVAHDRPHIDLLTRGDAGWILRAADGLEASLSLAAISVELPLVEIYERVEF